MRTIIGFDVALKALKKAPTSNDDISDFLYKSESDLYWFVSDFCGGTSNAWRRKRLPDVISEMVEFCARMVELCGCRHLATVITSSGSDGLRCKYCTAEYHGRKWV